MQGASANVVRRRRQGRPKRSRLLWHRSLVAAVFIAGLGAALGLAFAGSPRTIAPGVRVAGVDVGGLTPAQARTLLKGRARSLARVPVTFTDGSRTWRLSPVRLGVRVDFGAAVDDARRQGGGVGPLRGLRRLGVRVFGTDIAPPARVWDAALALHVRRIAAQVDRPGHEASVELRGLRPVVVAERAGRVLDREAAAMTIVRGLTSLQRAPVALPVREDQPSVTASDLEPAVAQARTAVSAPVRLVLGPTRWRLPRWRVAELLALPHGGSRELRIAGPGATEYFARLRRRVDRPAADADFAVSGTSVSVVPARAGFEVDVQKTAERILAAALSPSGRTARVAVATTRPERSTEEARSMGITGLVSSYETTYAGDANRVHNVRLVAHLVDGALIAPGATFSFNGTTGERTAERGFREAPVIINGELQTGLGGGVCQVSTTVFNAAYEAGLRIVARTNHALYISHYPQGRDATVNYPNLDLRFVNDTERWLLLRTYVGSSSLVVALYGAPTGRRVVTETAPLLVTGPAPIKRVPDPELDVGKTALEEEGGPSRKTSVRRLVYTADGTLLYDDTWFSSYRGEKRVIRVGTKKKSKPETGKPKPGQPPGPPLDPGPGLGINPGR